MYLYEQLNSFSSMFFYAHGKECKSEYTSVSAKEDDEVRETTTTPEFDETIISSPRFNGAYSDYQHSRNELSYSRE